MSWPGSPSVTNTFQNPYDAGTLFRQTHPVHKIEFQSDFAKTDTVVRELRGEADEGSHLNSRRSRHAVWVLRTCWRPRQPRASQTPPTGFRRKVRQHEAAALANHQRCLFAALSSSGLRRNQPLRDQGDGLSVSSNCHRCRGRRDRCIGLGLIVVGAVIVNTMSLTTAH